MKCVVYRKIRVILFTLTLITILSAITPVLAGSYFPDGRPNPAALQHIAIDTSKYELPGTFSYSYGGQNFDLGKSWEYDFHLTQAQKDTLNKLDKENPNLTEYDAFNQIVPDQVALLPADLQNWIKQILFDPPANPCYQYDPNTGIGIDPSGTIVPHKYVPNDVLQGLDPNYNGPAFAGACLMEYGTVTGYTPESVEHLANLGLSTDYTKADLNATSSMVNGQYTISLYGNTPQGVRKSWTFVIDDFGVWHDSANGQVMNVDAQYVLAALQYVSSPMDNTETKQVSNSFSTPISTMPKGVTSTLTLSSIQPKSYQYTQSIHNPIISTNILIPKIVVSSSVPVYAEVNSPAPPPAENGLVPALGNQFYQPDLIGWANRIKDDTVGKDWTFGFWLTPSQDQELTVLIQENPDLTKYDAYNQVVPDQMAALPEDLQIYLKSELISPISDGSLGYNNNENQNITMDSLVPKNVVSSTSPVIQNSEFIPFKTNSMNTYTTNIQPVILPAYQQENLVKLNLPLSRTGFPKNIAFV